MSLLESIKISLNLEYHKWHDPYVLIIVGHLIDELKKNQIEDEEKNEIEKKILRPVAYSGKKQYRKLKDDKPDFFACFPAKSSDEFSEHAAVYFQWKSNPGNDILGQVEKAVGGLDNVMDEFYNNQAPPELEINICTPNVIQNNEHILYISEKMDSVRRKIGNKATFLLLLF